MGKPSNQAPRGFARRGAQRRIASKNGKKRVASTKEINVHQLIALFQNKVDPKTIVDRIKKVNNFHKNDKEHTYDAFGVKHFIDKDGPKVNGELINKRPDLRVVEVALSGEQANPVSYEIPIHPIQNQPHDQLEIVKQNLITVEKIAEILEFVKSDKFNSETLTVDFAEGTTEENQIQVRDVIQLLAGIHSAVSIADGKLKVKKFVVGKDKRQQSWLWPKKYVRFVLQRNMRFQNVLEKAARRMGLNTHSVFQRTTLECGVGYTHQFCQVEKIEPELVREGFERESCNVSNFEFSDTPIEKMKFRGYRFKFSIRKYKNTPEETAKIMNNFGKNGYINYYYVAPSVLGRTSITDVGKNLIKNDCMGAAKLIYRPRPVDRNAYEELKELTFICQDARLVAPLIKQRINVKENTGILARLFQTMLKDNQGRIGPKNADSAFEKANINQIIEYTDLYLQAIWNETVNMLIEKRGLKLQAGDLVFIDEGKEQKILFESQHGPTVPKDSLTENRESLKDAVRSLTQEEIDSGEYSIHDLVIPVCGWDVKYPENETSTYIDEILKKNGIDNKEWFEEKSKNMTTVLPVSYPGTYRKVIQLPDNLKWEIQEYTEEKVPLVLGDVPRNTRKATREANGKPKDEKKDEEMETDEPKKEEGEGGEEAKKEEVKLEPQNALVVEFILPKGTHLMTPLRELFKKNDFGTLASPFYERLVEPKRIEAFKKKLAQLQVALIERSRKPFMQPRPLMDMGGAPMRGDVGYHGGPPGPAPFPDQAMQRIQMLERELAAMRNERSLLQQQQQKQLFGKGSNGGPIMRENFLDSRDRFYEDKFERGPNTTSFSAARDPYERRDISRGGNSYGGNNSNNDSFSEQPLKRMRADFGRSDDNDRYDPFENNAYGNNSGNINAGGNNRFGGNNLPSLFDSAPIQNRTYGGNIGGNGGNKNANNGNNNAYGRPQGFGANRGNSNFGGNRSSRFSGGNPWN